MIKGIEGTLVKKQIYLFKVEYDGDGIYFTNDFMDAKTFKNSLKCHAEITEGTFEDYEEIDV